MIKIEKNILYSFLFVFALHSACSAHASITIQYAQQTTNDTASAISKVLFHDKELPHITLTQLADEKQKTIMENQEALFKGWNRTYLAQTGIYLVAGATFIAHYINEDAVATLRKTALKLGIIKTISGIKPWKYKLAASSLLLGIAVFPIVHYFKLFKLQNIDFWYPHEEIDETIAVFRKKTFSHRKVSGNIIIDYYNISDPIGYMTLKERDNVVAIAQKSSQRMHLSLLNATLCGAGLIWAAAR